MDPEIHYKVNIGLPQPMRSRREVFEERLEYLKKTRHNSILEKLARENKCKFINVYVDTAIVDNVEVITRVQTS